MYIVVYVHITMKRMRHKWSFSALLQSVKAFALFRSHVSHSEQLRRHCNLHKYVLEVDIADLEAFDAEQSAQFKATPSEYITIVREAK